MKAVSLMVFLKFLRLQPILVLRKQLLNWEQLAISVLPRVLACTLVSTLALALTLLATPAYADVWGYVDAKGVGHFAAEKLDARYELYFKGGSNFNTQDGLPGSAASPATVDLPRPVAVPKMATKLLAYFDVSPNFKAVKHHLREASNTHRIDFELLQALIATESGFDTAAVSPKGAVGLMQLMPPTAQRYGVQADAKTSIEKKLTDPKTNIRAGSRYLSDLMRMFPGKLELALAAYNAGEGAVQRYGNQIPPFKETQNYVKTVMQIYATLKPPASIAQIQADNRQPMGRVRMELGGAMGRGNMVPPLSGTLSNTLPIAASSMAPAPAGQTP